jgi:CBS domain-containing protein
VFDADFRKCRAFGRFHSRRTKMTSLQELDSGRALTLNAATAADLMTSNPLSIRQNATVKEAAAFLTDRKISAAPVIDDAGRAVGVLSRADIVLHHRQEAEFVPEISDYYERTDLAARADEQLPAGFQVENVDPSQVRDIMTPLVLAVSLNDSAHKVLTHMVDEKVHRLFVLDGSNVLVGVISALDVLRKLY